ncbi:hypothetical protein [Streptomyces rubradiris]|uniref:Uncharacterized protein n=1 Tax=Streptomyces rubradiris TaxID=285531 RepID=A0ABQ3R868_STRRR|nr:hypothetical protein [Streptomyces rubradiris]GHH22816.1 hypothetical protein GCM10018792_58690 [Streptomyces rubradiris]GHI52049.1 hypothetical protein Srubr_18950 [Streptomyces rubradiris]
MSSAEMTVQDLIDLLSACERDAPVRQALNPFFPVEHRLAQVIQAMDATGKTVVYLAEGGDEHSQLGALPPEVAVKLAWQSPVQPPPRRARRTARGGQ